MALSLVNKEVEEKYNIIRNITKKYNFILWKVTGKFKGKIHVPNKDKINKKEISTLNQYLNNKIIWSDVYNISNELNKSNISIDDYITTVIENWDNVRLYLFIEEKAPIPKIIFSKKCITIYNSIKRNEEQVKENNKNIVVKKENISKYESNLKKLNNMLKQHTDLTDLDILLIFKNEFDIDFIECYKKEGK